MVRTYRSPNIRMWIRERRQVIRNMRRVFLLDSSLKYAQLFRLGGEEWSRQRRMVGPTSMCLNAARIDAHADKS